MKKWLNERPMVWLRRLLLLLLDLCIVGISVALALSFRYEGGASRAVLDRIEHAMPLILLTYGACGILTGIYSAAWRYAGLRDLLKIVLTYSLAAAITLGENRILFWRTSRPVFVMTGMWVIVLVASSRFTWKYLRERLISGRKARGSTRILIVGAGESGAYAVRLCQQDPNYGVPVAIVDDDPLKQRMRVGGVPVCGTAAEIEDIVRRKGIHEIIIALPSLHGERKTEIISACKATRCRIRVMSNPDELGAAQKGIRELNTSDFLSRAEVKLDMDGIRGYLGGRVVLVTGGGGSIGSEICRQIMRFSPKLLLIFDVYENSAYELECELKRRYGAECPIRVLIGSIRDRKRLDDVFETYHPSVVFHAAAHKHVPLMEVSPCEAIKNNVVGTRNLLESASAHGVERLVQLSTDKAVNPTNVMGATKRICEMLIQQFARTTQMKCMAVRFGNVLGSHGSVIPLFESQIRSGGPVTLTHPDIIRYFMTIPEAAQLVLQAGALADPGAIYVLDMGEPVRIMDLAKKLIRFYGYEPDVNMEIRIVGLRPGEKLYEELLMDREKDRMTRTAHNKIFVAPPIELDAAAFERGYAQLSQLADADDAHAVVEKLTEVVGTYTPDRKEHPATA